MKANIRKISVLLLTLTMVIGMMVVPSFAIGTGSGTQVVVNGTNYNTGTSSVTVSDVANGDTVSAYKVVELGYDNVNKSVTYDFTQAFKDSGVYTGTIYDYLKLTEAQVEGVLGAYTAYVKANAVAASATQVSNGSDVSFTLGYGQYIIVGLATATSTRVYYTVSAELMPDAQNKIYPAYALSMKHKDMEPEKTVSTIDNISYTDADGNTKYAEIGDVVEYKLAMGGVPVFATGSDKSLSIIDTLTTGLTLNQDSIVVKGVVSAEASDTLVKGTDYTVTGSSESGFTVNFVYDNVKEYTDLVVEYSATINSDVVITTSGMTNNAQFNFGQQSTTKSAIVYSLGIKVNKTAITEDGEALSGAAFTIYSDEELKTAVGNFVTGEDGVGTFNGLKPGDYYLVETAAPEGYKLLTSPVKVTITKDDVDANDNTIALHSLNVVNYPGQNLPSTGGMGTTIFTIIGLCLMLGAGILLITKKRMTNRG